MPALRGWDVRVADGFSPEASDPNQTTGQACFKPVGGTAAVNAETKDRRRFAPLGRARHIKGRAWNKAATEPFFSKKAPLGEHRHPRAADVLDFKLEMGRNFRTVLAFLQIRQPEHAGLYLLGQHGQ